MDRQWLESQFTLHPEKKKAALAKVLNLEAPAISKILAGIREIKATEYVQMRKFFGLSIDENSMMSVSKNAYIIKPLQAKNTYEGMQDHGKKHKESNQSDWMIPADLMKQKTLASPDQIKSFKIEGDSMNPDFNAGEYVLVDTSIKNPSPSGVFLIFDGLGEIIRQCEYVPQSDPPSVKLVALKSGYESCVLELKNETIIGRIIAKVQWVG